MASESEPQYKACEVYTDGAETAEESLKNEDLVKASTRYPHRLPGEMIYKGMLLNKVIGPEAVIKVKEIELRSDDILICGFLRTGTTWLGEILYLLKSDVNVQDMEQKMCYSRVLWIDDERSHKLLDDFPRPRLMKSHLLPKMLSPTAFSNKSRLVLAIRNPKDVAVAYYHFYKMHSGFGNFAGSFEEFISMFMDSYVQWGDWRAHINTWWQAAKANSNVLPVFYEEMKADPHQAVRKLAHFLQKEVTDSDVERIVNETSFSKMSARPTTNLKNIKAFSGDFIRKGEVGDWRNHFSEELRKKFDAWIRSCIEDEELRSRLGV